MCNIYQGLFVQGPYWLLYRFIMHKIQFHYISLNATSLRYDREQYIYVRINVEWCQIEIEKMITTGTRGSIEDFNQSIDDGICNSPLNIVGIWLKMGCVFSPQIDAYRVSIWTLSVKLR